MSRHSLIFLDKTFFQIVFYLIVLLAKLRKGKKPSFYLELKGTERILVIRPGGLGDGIMCIPLLKVLRKRLPKSIISLVCVRKNRTALEHLPYFDEIIVIDEVGSLHKNMFKLLRNHYDVVLDVEPFRKVSSIVSYLSGADIRIGFDTNNRRLLYTHYVTYANEKRYESLNMIRQLEVLNIKVSEDEAVDMSFPVSDEVVESARSTLRNYGLCPDRDFIVGIVPGVLKKHHRWIMEEFSSLIDLILDEDSTVKVLLLGTPAEKADAQEVLGHLRDEEMVTDLVGKTSFMEVLGILNACRILISCDGGVVYMGAAMGCCTISLWGPGVMDRFKPPGESHIGIRKAYFCIPCVNYSRLGEFPKCPYGRKCLKDISAEDVFEQYLCLKKIVVGTNLQRVISKHTDERDSTD